MTANETSQPIAQAAASRENCAHCKFWIAAQQNVGFCRRYPPTIQMFQVHEHPNSNPIMVPSVQFPIVSMAAWCGEFVEKSRIVTAKMLPG
jgi:hypothetical protein